MIRQLRTIDHPNHQCEGWTNRLGLLLIALSLFGLVCFFGQAKLTSLVQTGLTGHLHEGPVRVPGRHEGIIHLLSSLGLVVGHVAM